MNAAADVRTVGLVSTTGVASLLGISKHALLMRINRGSDTVPPPDRQLEGCQVWFATRELAAALGVTADALNGVSVWE